MTTGSLPTRWNFKNQFGHKHRNFYIFCRDAFGGKYHGQNMMRQLDMIKFRHNFNFLHKKK